MRRKEVAYQTTGSAYWMIDVAFSPNGKQIVTLCDSIQVLLACTHVLTIIYHFVQQLNL